MINEIKIDHTKTVWANVWNGSGVKYKRIYLYTLCNRHFCVDSTDTSKFLTGENFSFSQWDCIEFIKEKKRIQLDAKSCPRRPVLTHPSLALGTEFYPDVECHGLACKEKFITWKQLKEEGWLINGQPASREVDE